MTSSFTLPKGMVSSLYRAEPVTGWNQRGPNLKGVSRETVATQWVLLDNSVPGSLVPPPPDREADYVGQIVAIATRASATAS